MNKKLDYTYLNQTEVHSSMELGRSPMHFSNMERERKDYILKHAIIMDTTPTDGEGNYQVTYAECYIEMKKTFNENLAYLDKVDNYIRDRGDSIINKLLREKGLLGSAYSLSTRLKPIGRREDKTPTINVMEDVTKIKNTLEVALPNLEEEIKLFYANYSEYLNEL